MKQYSMLSSNLLKCRWTVTCQSIHFNAQYMNIQHNSTNPCSLWNIENVEIFVCHSKQTFSIALMLSQRKTTFFYKEHEPLGLQQKGVHSILLRIHNVWPSWQSFHHGVAHFVCYPWLVDETVTSVYASFLKKDFGTLSCFRWRTLWARWCKWMWELSGLWRTSSSSSTPRIWRLAGLSRSSGPSSSSGRCGTTSMARRGLPKSCYSGGWLRIQRRKCCSARK